MVCRGVSGVSGYLFKEGDVPKLCIAVPDEREREEREMIYFDKIAESFRDGS